MKKSTRYSYRGDKGKLTIIIITTTVLDERMSCLYQQAVLYRERECSTDNFALSAHP